MTVRDFVRCEMLVDVDWRAGATLSDWLRLGLEAFGGNLARAAWAGAPLRRPRRGTFEGAVPGEVWCSLRMSKTPTQDRASPTTPLSAPAWSRFLTRAGEVPDHAQVRVTTVDSSGWLYAAPSMSVHGNVISPAELQRESDVVVDRGLLQLLAYLPTDWLADPSYQHTLTTAWLELAHRANPVFGELAFGHSWWTELEEHLRAKGNPHRNMLRAREFLRGYGWLTLCPRQLGERLGGVTALRPAFARVVELDSGGFWLQATESYVDYDLTAAERVYRALAPVLVPGQPSFAPGEQPLLVAEDPRPEPDRPDRSFTKPVRPKGAPPLPSFVLRCLDGRHWELWHDGEPCAGWEHENPKYVRILAEVVIAEETGLTVVDWTEQDDGVRAVVADPSM